MLYKKTVNGGFMSFDDGLKSGNYSKNTYSEDSAEFDSFERGCTQALKRGLLNIDRCVQTLTITAGIDLSLLIYLN